jgi:hypothetical protein
MIVTALVGKLQQNLLHMVHRPSFISMFFGLILLLKIFPSAYFE